MATRTFAGWGGRPKGEPAKVCQNRRFCQNLHKKLIICKKIWKCAYKLRSL